jgi:hypothetical protein
MDAAFCQHAEEVGVRSWTLAIDTGVDMLTHQVAAHFHIDPSKGLSDDDVTKVTRPAWLPCHS